MKRLAMPAAGLALVAAAGLMGLLASGTTERVRVDSDRHSDGFAINVV